MQMQLNRDDVLVTKGGHALAFLKDTPTYVPPKLVREILAAGGVLVEDDKSFEKATLEQLSAEAKAGLDRTPIIEEGIRKLLKRNQRGDFTAGARPNLNVLFRETGIQITSEELEPVWNKVKAEVQ